MHKDTDDLLKIVRYLDNLDNAQLKQEIADWRKLSEANEIYYQRVSEIWYAAPDVKLLEEINPEDAARRFADKLPQYSFYKQDTRRGRSGYSWLRAAAAVLLIAVLSYIIYNNYSRETYLTKATAASVKDSVLLADGSLVFLDANTTIRYPQQFKEQTRKVILESGNAFFKVSRDTTRPFIIQLNESNVKVLGTSFNIHKSATDIEVSVKTGKVAFQAAEGAESTVIHAGYGLLYNAGSRHIKIFSSVNHNSDAWISRELDFVDAPLADVFKKLEDYYQIKIRLEGSIADFGKFNARFKNSSMEEVLAILEQTYPIKITRNDSTVIIKSK